jgi:hypothetical protein
MTADRWNSVQGPLGSTMVLIRTKSVDSSSLALLERLRAQVECPVHLALDRVSGAEPVPEGLEHVALTAAKLADMGLFITGDVLWRCGDYAFYAARRQFPDVEFFWIIEPDVRINIESAADFFYFFTRHADIDLLVTFLGPADGSYPWTETMRPFASSPHKCMYPLLRLSARAIDHLLKQRQILSERFIKEPMADGRLRGHELWPNDEVFTATQLYENGFKIADLNFTGIRFYDSQTFSFQFPVSETRFRAYPLDGKIYHPVLASSAFLNKVIGMFLHIRNNGGPADHIKALFDRTALYDDIELECGLAARDDFAAQVRAAMEACS